MQWNSIVFLILFIAFSKVVQGADQNQTSIFLSNNIISSQSQMLLDNGYDDFNQGKLDQALREFKELYIQLSTEDNQEGMIETLFLSIDILLFEEKWEKIELLTTLLEKKIEAIPSAYSRKSQLLNEIKILKVYTTIKHYKVRTFNKISQEKIQEIKKMEPPLKKNGMGIYTLYYETLGLIYMLENKDKEGISELIKIRKFTNLHKMRWYFIRISIELSELYFKTQRSKKALLELSKSYKACNDESKNYIFHRTLILKEVILHLLNLGNIKQALYYHTRVIMMLSQPTIPLKIQKKILSYEKRFPSSSFHKNIQKQYFDLEDQINNNF